jgi:hypothetical protein
VAGTPLLVQKFSCHLLNMFLFGSRGAASYPRTNAKRRRAYCKRHRESVNLNIAVKGAGLQRVQPPSRELVRPTAAPIAHLVGRSLKHYCSFAFSALACFRMGMSGSASFQRQNSERHL